MNTKKEISHTLFQYASFNNTAHVISLLEKGANPNYINDLDGWGAIHYAARWGNRRMIAALLQYHVDVNLQTKDRETALHFAARWNRTRVAQLLMNHGARTDITDHDGKYAKDMTNHQEIVFMIEHWDIYKEKILEQKKIAKATAATAATSQIKKPQIKTTNNI